MIFFYFSAQILPNCCYAISIPSQLFLGCHLWFQIFSTLAFTGHPLFSQLGCFYISLLFVTAYYIMHPSWLMATSGFLSGESDWSLCKVSFNQLNSLYRVTFNLAELSTTTFKYSNRTYTLDWKNSHFHNSDYGKLT